MSNELVHVLLLGDDPAFVKKVRNWETPKNHPKMEFAWCRSLRDGLARLTWDNTSLVVTEMNLVDCSGLHTITQLLHYAPYVPLIVLASSKEEEQALEAVRLGAHGFLWKETVDQSIFQITVHHVLTRLEVDQL